MPIEPTRCFINLPRRMNALASVVRNAPVGLRMIPEPLVLGTVQAAIRIARDKAAPSQVLSRRTAWLVREATEALATNQWQLVLLLSLSLAGWRQ
jgi:hypothetical protein